MTPLVTKKKASTGVPASAGQSDAANQWKEGAGSDLDVLFSNDISVDSLALAQAGVPAYISNMIKQLNGSKLADELRPNGTFTCSLAEHDTQSFRVIAGVFELWTRSQGAAFLDAIKSEDRSDLVLREALSKSGNGLQRKEEWSTVIDHIAERLITSSGYQTNELVIKNEQAGQPRCSR